MPDDKKYKSVLVVDDNPSNIALLSNILRGLYKIKIAKNGHKALDIVNNKEQPDLVLLDIIMPDLDGFEVCKQLKTNVKTRDIPIIFLTAKTDVDDVTKGLALGAADFVSRPISPPILLARIATQLTLKVAQDALRIENESLEKKVQQRTQQLIHAERLATLGTFAAGIAHEINNPNSFVSNNIAFLKLFWQDAAPILGENITDEHKLHSFLPEISDALNGIEEGANRITKIVERLKTHAKKSAGDENKLRTPLRAPINDAIRLLKHRLSMGGRAVKINLDISKAAHIKCDRQQLSQVFVNLLINAKDAMSEAASKEPTITISARIDDDLWSVTVADNGPGIPSSLKDKIFDPFFTTKGDTVGTGLGLFIIQDILEDHGGTIELSATDNTGTIFTIALPALA